MDVGVATVTEPQATSTSDPSDAVVGATLGPVAGAAVALVGVGSVAVAGFGLGQHHRSIDIAGAASVLAWALAAIVVLRRGRATPAAAVAAASIAAALAATVVGGARCLGLVVAAMTLLGLGAPVGRLDVAWRRAAVAVAAGIGLAFAVVSGDGGPATAPFAGFILVAGGTALVGFVERCRDSAPDDRARLQWLGWSALVVSTVAALVAVLSLLLRWPHDPATWIVLSGLVVPVSTVAATVERLRRVADRVLVATISTAGVVLLVAAVYVVVVIGLGRSPRRDERALVGLSIAGAAVGAALAFPARQRLESYANQRVYGDRHAPDETLRTFAGRMSRAVPMDELQLQLVESLRKTMQLRRAELWTGTGGTLDRVTSVPDQGPGRVVLKGEELTVVARARVSGPAWLQVWMPALLEGRGDGPLRVTSVAHLGELLGLIVVERPADGAAFTETDEQVLGDLARQLGLALHNVRLDSALQASLEELEARNVDLQASRLRIVTAADESRRQIERNLHDGAQQHLVALAVKIGLVRQLIDGDRETAETMLEELRGDVQATLQELRELAHGIYPPLLRDRGLSEALRTAANRSVLHTAIDAVEGVRYSAEIEAAVYFCCLEAVQNAGKYAGEGAEVSVRVGEEDGVLTFSVHDTGPGFDASTLVEGHGFTNMRDRLGAIGGDVVLRSAPGEGTTVVGTIPLAAAEAAEEAAEAAIGSAEGP